MTTNEEAQLSQTIQMFEVITESQPLDYQSLEILKEAYFKLGRQPEAIQTSKRIASAYLSLGQLSSAILEYEGIRQRFPQDPDVGKALAEIESKASNLSTPRISFETNGKRPAVAVTSKPPERDGPPAEFDDGRQAMEKIFVDGKFISVADFNLHWPVVSPNAAPREPVEPFVQKLAERQLMPLDASLKLLTERSRLTFLPLDRYDIDMDLARGFPREICNRWCILPIDRMSKSVLIATANPYNKQAVKDVENTISRGRLIWYIVSPVELQKLLRKIFR